MGTSFSGIGTPEWAVRYLSAAVSAIQTSRQFAEFELRFVLDREALCRKARYCDVCTLLQTFEKNTERIIQTTD